MRSDHKRKNHECEYLEINERFHQVQILILVMQVVYLHDMWCQDCWNRLHNHPLIRLNRRTEQPVFYCCNRSRREIVFLIRL